jgi:hypothetical protein
MASVAAVERVARRWRWHPRRRRRLRVHQVRRRVVWWDDVRMRDYQVGWFVVQHFFAVVVGLEVMDGSDPSDLTILSFYIISTSLD